MKSAQTDWINIGMMVISLLLAIAMPFKLFILAYAILGPLHYITEINWLNKKDFFIKDRSKFFLLLGMALLISLPYTFYHLLGFKFEDATSSWLNNALLFLQLNVPLMIFISLALAVLLYFLKKYWIILLALGGSFLLGLYIMDSTLFIVIIGILIPTLIHVYLFTLLFMLYGAIKSKSKIGFFTVGLLVLAPFIIANLTIDQRAISVDPEIQSTFVELNFTSMHVGLASLFGWVDKSGMYSILSPTGVKVQIFIAFAYLYHYLNWFAKTTVIGWHKAITKPKLIFLSCVWILSVSLYFYDYQTGFLALVTLSYIHVIFEFPLNFLTMKEVGKGIGSIFSGKAKA